MNKKVALVTGGTRGIGRAIAEDLLGLEYKVYVTYLSNEEMAAEFIKQHDDAIAIKSDISDYNAAKTLFTAIMENESTLDVLINNAGITKDKSISFMNEKSWNRVINTNLNGTFNCTKFAGRYMIRQESGCIVNISSVSSRYAIEGQSNYSASKGAVDSFTRVAAKELAKYNIRVNSVNPGFTKTDMLNSLSQEELLKSIALGRFASPSEISSVVMFLLSSSASYITGQNIIVDGGLSI